MNKNRTTSTIEFLDNNKVKLTVEVDEKEFDSAIDAAFKRISKKVRVPGFRPGRVPRRILEVQLGHQYGRAEALRNELPSYYQQAVIRHDVDVIDSPDIEITAGEEEGAVIFDATVEVRPVIEVVGYDSLRLELPNPEPSVEEITAEIDRLRTEHAEYQSVQRAAQDGDQLNLNIFGSHEGEEVPGLSATDYDYEVGSAAVVPEIDENLRGASVGDEIKFEAPHPDPDEQEPLYFAIEVLDVKQAQLAPLEDSWVAETTEFETVEELRADITQRLGLMKSSMAQNAANLKLTEALSSLVTQDIPAAMVSEEVNNRLQEMFGSLQQQTIDPSEFLKQTGRDLEQLKAELAEGAQSAVKVDLALRAIALAEGLSPDDERLREVVDEMAEATGIANTLDLARLEEMGQLSALRADVAKKQAIEWLLANVEAVDEEGKPLDLKNLQANHDGAVQ